MIPSTFLTALWGAPPPGPVLVWTQPDKLSRWYRTFDTVDADLLEHESHEIYFGAGLAPAHGVRLTSRTRVKEQDVAGIAGLWADVDVAHPVHAKAANLPPDRKRAIDVLDRLPIKATILVDTGHGIHAWWLFPEPWIFSCAEQRDLARKAIKWWQATMKELFSERGWTIDSTHDLSRLMRLPGTCNGKDPHDRRPVEVVRNTEERYPKELFLDLLPDDFEATPLGPRKAKSRRNDGAPPPNPGLVLDPDAEPPFLKVEVLLDHDPRFRSTWHHTRRDLGDQSPSGYDLALADAAVGAGWSDQEVVDLLIAFRRKHRLTLKIRSDYFETTLRKAKNFFQREHVVQSALDMADSLDNAGEKGESADTGRGLHHAGRSEILTVLSTLFRKINIIRIERFCGVTTTYVLVTDRGRVHLRGVRDVLNQRMFIERVAEATGRVLEIQLKKKQRWSAIAQLLLDACIDHDMGEVGSPETECQAWIEGYLIDRGMVDDLSDAASEHLPLLHEARIHIYLYDLMEWVHHQLGVKADSHDMAERLLTLGWSPARFNVVVGGRRTTYRSWRCGEDYQPIDG